VAAGQGGGPHGQEHDERVVLPATERLGRKGPEPVLVFLLVAAAFFVGVVRPWDWLAPGGGVPEPQAGPTQGIAGDAGATRPAASGAATTRPTTPATPVAESTCAYPRTWRLATVQDWGGRTARVWSAADAVIASGPGDPAIPFVSVVTSTVTALGWCAPVTGSERPPKAAVGTLYRIGTDGPHVIGFDRLEPAAPDALGELWLPVPQSVGRRPPWAPGRYVIRLAAPGGSFERYLGIEVVRAARSTDAP